MTIGSVDVNKTPMIMTFDKDHVDYICGVLGESILMAYNVIEMFSERDDYGYEEYEEYEEGDEE